MIKHNVAFALNLPLPSVHIFSWNASLCSLDFLDCWLWTPNSNVCYFANVQDIFERFDRDRSGKIDVEELRDALYSIGYVLPPSVLRVLISRYDDGSGLRVELNFDSFIEYGPQSLYLCPRIIPCVWSSYINGLQFHLICRCGMVVKVGVLFTSAKWYQHVSSLNYHHHWICKLSSLYWIHLQGLTDKFKAKDMQYMGSATVSYDDFLSMIIPFLVSYNWMINRQEFCCTWFDSFCVCLGSDKLLDPP